MMNACIKLVLILMSFSRNFGKYVYISSNVPWLEAQRYCRERFTDLAPVTNKYINNLVKSVQLNNTYFWIGLEREIESKNRQWMWSGGGIVNTFFWAEKAERRVEIHTLKYGAYLDGLWNSFSDKEEFHFLCYEVVVKKQEKTWEEAAHACRVKNLTLASVNSETEMMLIQAKLKNKGLSGKLWIGLRYFEQNWLWMDRYPITYTAWTSDQHTSLECPPLEMRCGALRVENIAEKIAGEWEAYNCHEKLPFICH